MLARLISTFLVLLLYSLHRVKGDLNLSVKNIEMIQSNFHPITIQDPVNVQQFLLQFLDLSKLNKQDVSMRCLIQLYSVVNSENGLMYKFIDSWGKLPSGVLKGNLLDMGNFNECIEIEEELANNDQLNGKYCLSRIPLGELVNGSAVFQNMQFRLGICMPQACSAETINLLLRQFLSSSFNTSLDASTTLVKESNCTKGEVAFTALDWITVILLSIFGILLVLSTILDYVYEYYETPLHTLLGAFSIRINAKQLFYMRSTKSNPHVIPCLNGIRVLSIIWIILAHDYITYMGLMAADNNLDILTWYSTPFASLITNALPSVDTFLFLSGLLLGMIALRQIEKNGGRLNVPMMYLHRFLRLTPQLAIAVLVYMSIFRYMANGPLWNSEDNDIIIGYCNQSWWATILYVQNYVYPHEMCFGHTWYLSVDTQLYVLSPLALISLAKWRHKGLGALVVVVLVFFACLFSIIMVNDISVSGLNTERMRLTYHATHARINPWLIGLMFGYYLHCKKGRRVTLPKWLVLLGWIVSLGLLVTVIYSLYPSVQPGAAPLTPLESAFYLSFSRIAWPLALCWIVFACVNGYGGPINDFLSWSYWEPLSKLTYSMYIWHKMVEYITSGQIKHNYHFSDYDMIIRFWSDFGLSVMLAFIMHLAVEAPMAGIEKAIFAPRKQKETTVVESKSREAAAATGHTPDA